MLWNNLNSIGDQKIKRKVHIFLCRACLNIGAGDWSSFQHWLLWASWVHFERKGRIVLNMKLMNNLSSSQHIKLPSFEVSLNFFFYDFCALKITDCTKKKMEIKRKKDFCISKDKSKKSHTDKDCKTYILTAVKMIQFLFVLCFFLKTIPQGRDFLILPTTWPWWDYWD